MSCPPEVLNKLFELRKEFISHVSPEDKVMRDFLKEAFENEQDDKCSYKIERIVLSLEAWLDMMNLDLRTKDKLRTKLKEFDNLKLSFKAEQNQAMKEELTKKKFMTEDQLDYYNKNMATKQKQYQDMERYVQLERMTNDEVKKELKETVNKFKMNREKEQKLLSSMSHLQNETKNRFQNFKQVQDEKIKYEELYHAARREFDLIRSRVKDMAKAKDELEKLMIQQTQKHKDEIDELRTKAQNGVHIESDRENQLMEEIKMLKKHLKKSKDQVLEANDILAGEAKAIGDIGDRKELLNQLLETQKALEEQNEKKRKLQKELEHQKRKHLELSLQTENKTEAAETKHLSQITKLSSELRLAKMKIARLLENHDSMKGEVITQRDRASKRVDLAKSQLSKLKERLRQMLANREAEQQMIQKMKDDVMDQKKIMTQDMKMQMRNEIERLRNNFMVQKSRMENLIQEKNMDLESLKDKLIMKQQSMESTSKHLKAQLDLLNQRQREFESSRAKLESQERLVQQQTELLEAQRQKLADQQKSTRSKEEYLRNQLNTQRARYDNEMNLISDRIKKLNTRNRELQMQLKKCSGTSDTLRYNVKEIENKSADAFIKNQQLMDEVKELKEQLSMQQNTATEVIRQHQSDLQDAIKRVEDAEVMHEDVVSMRQRIQRAQLDLAQKAKEMQEAQDVIRQLQSERDASVGRMQILENEKRRMELVSSQSSNLMKELEKGDLDLKSEIVKYQSEKEALAKKLKSQELRHKARIHSMKNQMEAKIELLRKKVANGEMQKELLENERDKMKHFTNEVAGTLMHSHIQQADEIGTLQKVYDK